MGFESAPREQDAEERAFEERLKHLPPQLRMQVELARDYFGHYSNEIMQRWVGNYAERFSKMIGAHPEILKRYETDRAAALHAAAEILYAEEPAEKRE